MLLAKKFKANLFYTRPGDPMNRKPEHPEQPQQHETHKETQRSHGSTQHHSKKTGHVSQIGTGQDQQSQRQRGGGARRRG
jgi:hypothetical protein